MYICMYICIYVYILSCFFCGVVAFVCVSGVTPPLGSPPPDAYWSDLECMYSLNDDFILEEKLEAAEERIANRRKALYPPPLLPTVIINSPKSTRILKWEAETFVSLFAVPFLSPCCPVFSSRLCLSAVAASLLMSLLLSLLVARPLSLALCFCLPPSVASAFLSAWGP